MAGEENWKDEELDSFDETHHSPFQDSLFSQKGKRSQSVYSQHQSVKPINTKSFTAAQKRKLLNPDYKKEERKVSQSEKQKLTRACHRSIAIPLVKIIGRIPSYVNVSELHRLRGEFAELHKEYYTIVNQKKYDIHRRHVELMEINKITSKRLKERFIETLKAYGISANVISDVLAEFK